MLDDHVSFDILTPRLFWRITGKELNSKKEGNQMDYQKALLEVYQSQYPNGICGKMEDCSKGMPNAGHRCSIAKIGCNYGKTGKPKVLFVGKEGISDSGGSMATTISEPAAMEDIDRDNWHYIGTIYTAALLLTDANPSAERICWDEMRSFSELRHDFCLTNYFKCAFKTKDQQEKHHDVKTNLQMSKNCAKILLEEIRAIQPDIVVVQGKFCHSSFWNKNGLCSFAKEETRYEPTEKGWNITAGRYEFFPDGPYFYVIWSFHPCARGRKWFHSLSAFHEVITQVKDDWKANPENLER